MTHDLLEKLQSEIDTYWAKAGLGSSTTVLSVRQDDGSPHVEVKGGFYDIVITERGQESERFAGLSLIEAARWYLFSMATGRAQAAELRDRQAPETPIKLPNGLEDDGYSRWNWMAPAIETMQRMSPSFGDYARAYYADTLRNSPLTDYEVRNARWAFLEGGE